MASVLSRSLLKAPRERDCAVRTTHKKSHRHLDAGSSPVGGVGLSDTKTGASAALVVQLVDQFAEIFIAVLAIQALSFGDRA